MKATTKGALVLAAAVVIPVLYARRRRKRQAAEQAALPYQAPVQPIRITTQVARVVPVVGAPEPDGGWEAWATPSALLANLQSCKATGSVSPQDQAVCAMESLFPKTVWPPSAGAGKWQVPAWTTALSAAVALQGGPDFQ